MFQQPLVIIKASDSPANRYEQLLAAFTSQRVCTSGANAMQLIESAPARIAIIEASLEDMDAVDLGEMIRDVDKELNRFTYLIIVGEQLTPEIEAGLASHIDAFVRERDLASLAHVSAAGGRMSQAMNEIIEQNVMLTAERSTLLAGQMIDPLTGLGNRRMAMQTLEDTIAQIESRGGAVCLLMLMIDNRQDILDTYDEKIANELVQGVAERLNSLVRPMDTVTYFEQGIFALVLLQPSIEHCSAECYKRLYDGVRLKSYRTAIGYLDPHIGMSICASHAENGVPLPQRMIDIARDGLDQSVEKEQICVSILTDG